MTRTDPLFSFLSFVLSFSLPPLGVIVRVLVGTCRYTYPVVCAVSGVCAHAGIVLASCGGDHNNSPVESVSSVEKAA